MIRRHVGNEFWLIAQHDHALLAGALARHVGNHDFERPSEQAILGIELHDCGWPVHDERPTLNARGLPLDVFESPRAVALEVWQASVDRARARDPYAALLVSLHVLALSVFAATQEKANLTDAKAKFEVNRFQHKQIETQEDLRRTLGLPVDLPMRQGLVEDPKDEAELQLQFHFRLLQALDQISLGLCCTRPPWNEIRPVLPRAGGNAGAIKLSRESETRLSVTPFPFDSDPTQLSVPFRRVSGRAFGNREEFGREYASAPVETLSLEVKTG